MRIEATDLPDASSAIFLAQGLDDPNQLEIVHEISFYAHAILRGPRSSQATHRSKTRLILPDRVNQAFVLVRFTSGIRHRGVRRAGRLRGDKRASRLCLILVRSWPESEHFWFALTSDRRSTGQWLRLRYAELICPTGQISSIFAIVTLMTVAACRSAAASEEDKRRERGITRRAYSSEPGSGRRDCTARRRPRRL